MPRTNKHASIKDKFNTELASTLKKMKETVIEDGEKVVPINKLKHFVNLRISLDPSVDLGCAVKLLQTTYKEYDIHSKVVLCSNCAKKIGVKRCSACPKTSEIRYCSRQCQVWAWSSHKKTCCGADVE